MGRWSGDRLTAASVAGVTVLALGFAQGGYFAPVWGWAALGLLWVAAIALVVRRAIAATTVDALFLGGLAGLGVWMLVSSAWSPAPSEAVLESERTLVYVAGAAALWLVAGRATAGWLLGALLGAIAVLCAYGLATRLFPGLAGPSDSLAQYRLAEPLGYWNALGLMAAIGVLIAVGSSAAATSRSARAMHVGLLVLLVTTLYFTFGRAAWIALVAGCAVMLVLARERRAALLATILLATPWTGAAVAVAAGSPALTTAGSPRGEIADHGLRMAAVVVALSALSALATHAQPRVAAALATAVPPRAIVRAGAASALAAGLALIVAAGGPARVLERAQTSFSTPPAPTEGKLDQRLFRLYGEGRAAVWRVAWETAWSHPVAGSGAGSFEQRWLASRPRPQGFRNAHNLYLETLAETGIVGFAMLAAALSAPLIAAWRCRDHALAPVGAGAFAAYLVHAGVDWDWEMPAVTVAAVVCATAVLAIARGDGATMLGWAARVPAIAVLVVLAGLALVGLLGNGALGAGIAALREGDPATAEREAAQAARWAPWSAEPLRLAGEARLERGDRAGARASFGAAVRREPRDWALWYGLALASEDALRTRALARAAALNPLSPEVRELTQR